MRELLGLSQPALRNVRIKSMSAEVLRKLLDFLASVGEIDSDSEELSEEAEPTEPNDPLLAICGIAKTTPQMKKPREEQSGTAICKAEAGNPGEESGETSMAAVTPPAWVLRELGILTTQRGPGQDH